MTVRSSQVFHCPATAQIPTPQSSSSLIQQPPQITSSPSPLPSSKQPRAAAAMEVKGADRYRPDMLPALEKAVEEQAAGAKPFSLSVALAVLRLYALQPSAARREIVAKALLAALAQLPANDYKTCIYLVPERLQAEEPVATVVLLAGHLEAGRLADFWALATGSRELQALVPGFLDAARRFVAHTLAITFVRITKRQAADALRLEGRELDAYLAQREGWSVNGEVVVLPRNAHNTPSQRQAVELVPLDSVAPALAGAA